MRTLRLALLVGSMLGALPVSSPLADGLRGWKTRNTVLELSLASVLLVDTMQSVHFLREGHEELNPILGARPSVGTLIVYDVAAIGLHTLVAYILPEPYRTMWQIVWVGAEVWQVGSNVRTHGGLHVTLPWNW